MSHPSADLLEIICRQCAEAEPRPWYPSEFSRATGVPRDLLDANLDRLRLGGLVQLTPWVQELGQGYRLTQHGFEVLRQPRQLARLRQGELPPTTAVAAGPGGRPGSEAFTAHPTYAERTLADMRGEKVRRALLDDSRPLVTQLLLVLNIGYFLVGMAVYVSKFGGRAADYLMGQGDGIGECYHLIGSLHISDLVVGRQWWRLLVYGFLHGGALHLGANMYGLYILGPVLERWWGRAPYLAIYLISCVASGAAAVLLTPDYFIVGASGAICGLLGSMATWLLLNKTHLPPQIVQMLQRNIGTNIILIVIISLLPRVSWAGHLGGGVAGALVAVPLNLARFGTGLQRLLGWAATAVVVVVGFVGLQVWLNRGDASVLAIRRASSEVRLLQKAVDTFPDSIKNTGRYNWPGDPKAAEWAAKYRKTKQHLEEVANELKTNDPHQQPQLNEYFRTGLVLLELTIPYCDRVANALQSQQTWTEQERAHLESDFTKIKTAFDAHEEALKQMNDVVKKAEK